MSDCWDYDGRIDDGGYGIRYIPKHLGGPLQLKAHRFSWSAVNGDIPQGMCICHKCDNRRCVNPEHLFLGTHKDNTQDMISKGRYANNIATAHAATRAKTACKNGHEYTEKNTYIYKRAGREYRSCRTCNRNSHTIYRKARKDFK